MKSDILLSALIVSHTNAVLRTKKKIPFEAPALPGQYELLFECAPHNFISKFRRNPITVVDDWVSYQLACGLTSVSFWRPLSGENFMLHGLVNYGEQGIICHYKNGDAAAFKLKLLLQQEKQRWLYRYTENHLVSYDIPHDIYHDNTADFSMVLQDIAKLADDLDFPWFADRFREARAVLLGEMPYKTDVPMPHMSETGKRLMNAALISDLFGCMGSWNDSPAYQAEAKGLISYTTLSEALFSEIRMAVLYAANHA